MQSNWMRILKSRHGRYDEGTKWRKLRRSALKTSSRAWDLEHSCSRAGGINFVRSRVIALGTPPSASDTGEQVVAWFREHRDGARWFVWAPRKHPAICSDVRAAASFASSAPSRRVLIGAVTFWSLMLPSVDLGRLALHADNLEPATARTLLDVAVFWDPY